LQSRAQRLYLPGIPYVAKALPMGVFLFWSLAALWSLAQQTWQTEAGSLAPLVLMLGLWSLFECRARNRHLIAAGAIGPAIIVVCVNLPIYVIASAIDMVAVMAVCVWVGGIAAFYYFNGAALMRACAFPLAFLGLAIPLPYSLSMTANLVLRDFIADSASKFGRFLSLETAVDRHYIFIDQYQLSIDNACAGASSTMSLVAIGLLFAHWFQEANWKDYLFAFAVSVPIALIANVLRIITLLFLVRMIGPGLLDTALHPLSGVLSFAFALAMFGIVQRTAVIVRKGSRK
jgi:exosortase